MAISQTSSVLVATPGASYSLSSLFTVTPGANPVWLDLFIYDKSEYTAGISPNSFGHLSGPSGVISLQQEGTSDIYATQIVFQYDSSANDYYSSTYGWFSQLTYTTPSIQNGNEFLEIYETNSLNWTEYPQLALDVASRTTTPVATQATPSAIAAAAQTFVGKVWNLNGCWILACDIAAAAGTSLPVTAGIADGTGIGNGQWVPIYQGALTPSPNWQSLLRPGDVVTYQWVDNAGNSGSHTTTVVSGFGTAASLIDNVYLVNAAGQIVNTANDGSANDIIIQPARLAAQTFQWAITDTVTIYRLDTPIIAATGGVSLASLASTTLSALFSVNDPSGAAITAYQVYDTGSGTAGGTFMVSGTAEAGHSASTAVTIDAASLAATLFVAGSTAATFSDQIEIRATNGTYWGDWQAVTVSVQPSTAIENFLAQQNVPARLANGMSPFVAGSTGSASANGVTGWGSMTFAGGYDAVVLSGPRNQYAVQVDSSGKTTITDLSTGNPTSGQTMTVSGESYIIFNGGAASTVSGAPVYDQAYFVENPANAQLTEFYAAVLQRQPDLAGLEYWIGREQAGMPLTAIAQLFLNTDQFKAEFGDPATMTNSQYLTTLYSIVLGRSPDTAGQAYWSSQMANGMSQAEVLVNFTSAAATAFPVNATPDGGWLIVPSVSGGYADASLLMPAQSVLNQAAASGYLNTGLIDISGLSGTVSAGNLSLNGATSSITVTPGSASDSIVLSATINAAIMSGSNDTVIGATGGNSHITVTGGYSTVWLHGTSNAVTVSTIGNVISGFAAGDTVWLTAPALPAQVLAATQASPLDGRSLAFAANTYFLNVGPVGGGTPAEVAAAANAVYTVAGTAGEALVLFGQSGGDTVIYLWGGHTSGSADTNGNHHVDAAELTAGVTLIGVQATSLSAAAFHLG